MSCCAVFCPSRTTKGGVKDPELSFHTFPKCPEIRDQWIKAVRRKNWEPTKYSRLCSKHFEESSFVTGLSIKKLKTDAIPVIFEGYPSYYQPIVAKKRKQKSENLELTPRKRKRIKASSVKTEDLPTTPRRAMKVLTSLSKARTTALRHLRLVKTLRVSKRRIT
ncbi:unnamed protein product, partial [Brenthis ino]